MQVQYIMTVNPACCRTGSTIAEAARMMAEADCGALPVLDDAGELAGVVTDRDICCRAVAADKSSATPVSEVMSPNVLTVKPQEDVSSCCDRMEQRQVRRAVVIDESGKCCGIVAQADVAREAHAAKTAELVKDISERR